MSTTAVGTLLVENKIKARAREIGLGVLRRHLSFAITLIVFHRWQVDTFLGDYYRVALSTCRRPNSTPPVLATMLWFCGYIQS
jgi:hypothetical protein